LQQLQPVELPRADGGQDHTDLAIGVGDGIGNGVPVGDGSRVQEQGSPQSAAFSRVSCFEKPASAKFGSHGRWLNTTAGVGPKARGLTAPSVQPFRTTSTCTCD